jgi:hypothetical protein
MKKSKRKRQVAVPQVAAPVVVERIADAPVPVSVASPREVLGSAAVCGTGLVGFASVGGIR